MADLPPLPPKTKSSYSFDFTKFDDSYNPFDTKGGLANSPPAHETNLNNSHIMDLDPFAPSTKIMDSPLIGQDIDPFKTASKVRNSPPRSGSPPLSPYSVTVKAAFNESEGGQENNTDGGSSNKDVTNFMDNELLDFERAEEDYKNNKDNQNYAVLSDISNSPLLDTADKRVLSNNNNSTLGLDGIMDDLSALKIDASVSDNNTIPELSNHVSDDLYTPHSRESSQATSESGDYKDCFEPDHESVVIVQDSGIGQTEIDDRQHSGLGGTEIGGSQHSGLGQTEIGAVSNESIRVDELYDDTTVDNYRRDNREIKDSGFFGDMSSRRMEDEHFVDCSSGDDFSNASQALNDASQWELFDSIRGDGNEVKVPSDCRPSVFVRFDPLYQKQVLEDSASIGREVSEVIKEPEDRTDVVEIINDDLMQMSTPTKKQTPSNNTPKTGRHPALRKLEQNVSGEITDNHNIDQLLTMSPSESKETRKSASDDVTVGPQDIVEVLKYSQLDVNRIKKEMELQWNSRILVKEKELNKKIGLIQKEKDDLLKSRDEMRCLVAEYEKTMKKLLADREKVSSTSQSSMDEVKRERDQAIEDLQSVEAAFSDLHRRYEKAKAVIESRKQNEDKLKQGLNECITKLNGSEEMRKSVIAEAEEKLDKANFEIDKVKKLTAAENARLEAALKMKNVEFQTLQSNYEQKVAENKELVSICDDLIAKVGDS